MHVQVPSDIELIFASAHYSPNLNSLFYISTDDDNNNNDNNRPHVANRYALEL